MLEELVEPGDDACLPGDRRRHPPNVGDQRSSARVALPAVQRFGHGLRAISVEQLPAIGRPIYLRGHWFARHLSSDLKHASGA